MYHLPDGSLEPDVSVVLSGVLDAEGTDRITQDLYRKCPARCSRASTVG
jgi:hypothetical protein